jgi:hypothetical protein
VGKKTNARFAPGMSKKAKLTKILMESIMPGPISETILFIGKKFSTIKSGNSLFELIIFLCSYFDVAAGSYLIDHVHNKLAIMPIIVYGLFISAFIKIIIMLLFDEGGLSK